jgi:colicin import membrane protein
VIRKTDNLLSITLALLLHVALFGSLVVVLDFGRSPDIAIPLAINATLITENAVVVPPPVREPPKVEVPPKSEPPPAEPDTQEQERIAAEKRKLEEDARVEKARLQKIEDDKAEAERKRIADAEKQRKAREAEDERRRLEAEELRKADIERQRVENERLRKEAEDAARQAELDNETARVEQMTATAKQAYIFAIQQKITRNWVRPANAEVGLECTLKVQQMPGGEVVSVSFGSCNGDATIRRSIEAAVFKASPLPAPRDPSVFDRNLTLIFKPGV